MLLNARAVAILLAVCIATITTAFLSLTEGVSQMALLVAFMLAFGSSYLLTFITLEFFIFREINRIYEVLNKLREQEYAFTDEGAGPSSNPLKRINQEIYSYASDKQREIEELKRMAAFRREFLADVSHELKTPIFAAQGYIYTLLDGAVKDKTVRTKFLKKAAKSLDGLDLLVQDLLTLSQLEIGQIKMHYVYFDLIRIIRDVCDQVEGKAEKKEIVLRFDANMPEQLWVWADKQRIHQVIMNLISNAIKYSKEESEEPSWVEIKVEEGRHRVKVSVSDNGRGIPQEHLNRIFERFYRVEKSRSKGSGGTGLGLAIVKHILEAHKSRVEVKSVVGEGSTFSFKLKKKKEVAAKPAEKQELIKKDE
ncbi:sensor histidine kinase [Nafulsella turpanensis]|uniref:sensor histidine kinase n=1 Tax=Nafulsella turpanensis TaxID=1265690 RepID=UPI00034AA806|nr:ATP-binding protein [Nafulsella turpanensis]